MLLLILIAIVILGAQNQSPPKVLFNDQAIVTPRRTEKTHGSGEDRCTDVVIRPVVTGLRPSILKRIRKQLELKNVLGWQYSLYKNHWLYGFDYRVTHNGNHILAIRFNYNAYFADREKALVFDLRDGSLVKAKDLFREESISELAKLVDKKLQAELEQKVRDYEGPADLKYIWKAHNARLTFTADDIFEFDVNDKGITFFYTEGLHHTMAWAEPEGRYFLKYSELKDFLKPGTVVSQFVE